LSLRTQVRHLVAVSFLLVLAVVVLAPATSAAEERDPTETLLMLFKTPAEKQACASGWKPAKMAGQEGLICRKPGPIKGLKTPMVFVVEQYGRITDVSVTGDTGSKKAAEKAFRVHFEALKTVDICEMREKTKKTATFSCSDGLFETVVVKEKAENGLHMFAMYSRLSKPTIVRLERGKNDVEATKFTALLEKAPGTVGGCRNDWSAGEDGRLICDTFYGPGDFDDVKVVMYVKNDEVGGVRVVKTTMDAQNRYDSLIDHFEKKQTCERAGKSKIGRVYECGSHDVLVAVDPKGKKVVLGYFAHSAASSRGANDEKLDPNEGL
jgi:hypothetical protein